MSSGEKFLVISDLHAFSEPLSASSPSTLSSSDETGFPRRLFDQCASVVLSSFGKIDAILVAGDLVDKADLKALPFIWKELQAMAKRIGAPIIATAGNHDLDSHGLHSPQPNGALMALEPPFPANDAALRAQYFTEHHTVVRAGKSIVVTINSSALHGYTFKGEQELEHGRLAPNTSKFIRNSLNNAGILPATKIVLIHHHSLQLPDFDTEENSATVGGDELLRTLSHYGDWLIIHGHKHRGWVHYAFGGGDAPVIISSSSFSANLGNDDFARLVQRQFHVVEVHSHGPRGLVHSWNHDSSEWVRANETHMLPGISGFGWRTSIEALALRLQREITPLGSIDGRSLNELEPGLRYLTYDDRLRLLQRLEQGTPSIGHLLSELGDIVELQVRTF